jgi:hypothetical protein
MPLREAAAGRLAVAVLMCCTLSAAALQLLWRRVKTRTRRQRCSRHSHSPALPAATATPAKHARQPARAFASPRAHASPRARQTQRSACACDIAASQSPLACCFSLRTVRLVRLGHPDINPESDTSVCLFHASQTRPPRRSNNRQPKYDSEVQLRTDIILTTMANNGHR